MMLPITVQRSASSPTVDWIGRAVYESAAGTVALSDDPTTEVPFGVVREVDADLAVVDVVRLGITQGRVGVGGLTAGTSYFLAALDGATAAADGKLTDAGAGEYYVGYTLDLKADADADDMIDIFVCPGQLSIAAG